jgi:hypothetical protein
MDERDTDMPGERLEDGYLPTYPDTIDLWGDHDFIRTKRVKFERWNNYMINQPFHETVADLCRMAWTKWKDTDRAQALYQYQMVSYTDSRLLVLSRCGEAFA